MANTTCYTWLMIAIELSNDTKPKFLPQFAALSKWKGVDVNSIMS